MLDGSPNESSDNEEASLSQLERLSKTGMFWNKNASQHRRTKSHSLLKGQSRPAATSRIMTPSNAFDLLITQNIIHEIIKCTNLEGRRVAAENKIGKNKEEKTYGFYRAYLTRRN